MNLRLVHSPRTDVPVRVKLRVISRDLWNVSIDRDIDDTETLARVAKAIATLVEVERYLTDPATRWVRHDG